MNIVQWGNTLFATFYHLRPRQQAGVVRRGHGLGWRQQVLGHALLRQGTYFGLPWNPAEQIEGVQVRLTFTPSTSNNYQGTLTYNVIVGTVSTPVTKSIQRLTVVAVPLAGTYYGGQVGEYSGCTDTSGNTPYSDTFTLQVTQSAGNTLSLGFAYTSKLICTLSGTLSQNGLLYGIATASYLCSDQTDSPAVVTDLKVTAQGIEGH